MTATDGGIVAALAPVREALLAAAHADADQVRAEASERAARVLVAARREADRILTEARREGEDAVAAVLAAEQARARRQARATVLAQRREAYAQLGARARVAVEALAREPAIACGLEAAVRRALGEGARIREADGGGVVGEVEGRRLDCSLAGFAERAVSALLDELEEPA
jgi:hypothetical protein